MLEIDSVSVKFEGLVALSDVKFQINPEDICGLIGPNGAGKTTLINVLTGFQKPTSGAVRLEGTDLVGLKPEQVARRGIVRTFQAVRLFRSFTILENLAVTAVGVGRPSRAAEQEAHDVLDFMKLGEMARRRADTLPYGYERRVGIARALAARPRYLLLDEPAAGLNDGECEELMELVRAIPARFNCGVLLIEHNMHVVMNVCQRICVIDFGRKIAEGTPREIMANSLVRSAYLGTEAG